MRGFELKRLTDLRIKDACNLLQTRRYAACYYLAGYAVECALKACIAKQFRTNTIPDKRLVNRIYQHQLEELVGIAGLKQNLDQVRGEDPEFAANWNVIKDWNPESRYKTRYTRQEANDLLVAITDEDHGFLQWAQKHW